MNWLGLLLFLAIMAMSYLFRRDQPAQPPAVQRPAAAGGRPPGPPRPPGSPGSPVRRPSQTAGSSLRPGYDQRNEEGDRFASLELDDEPRSDRRRHPTIDRRGTSSSQQERAGTRSNGTGTEAIGSMKLQGLGPPLQVRTNPLTPPRINRPLTGAGGTLSSLSARTGGDPSQTREADENASGPASTVSARLHSAEGLRDAVILSEVFGPPRSRAFVERLRQRNAADAQEG